MQPSGPRFWRIGSPSGWLPRTASRDQVAVSDREGIRLSGDPHGPLALGSNDGSVGGLVLPRGMAFDDSGRLYLLDVAAARISRFDPESRTFVPLPHVGGHGESPREFIDPSSIAIASRSLYVCDEGNRRVQVFDLDTLTLVHVWDARGDRSDWTPVDLAAQGGDVYILDRARARIFRHTHRDHLVLVSERRDKANQWTRIVVDRDGRIYLLNETNPAYPVLESPDAAPPILDAGSIRDRFDPPALRLDAGNRFCLSEPFTRRCSGTSAKGPAAEVPLAACDPFNRAETRCDKTPKRSRHTRTAQGSWLLYVVEREQQLVNAFTAQGERLRHSWGPGLDWQPVDVAARGDLAFVLDERQQAVYRHQAGRENLRLLFRAEPPRSWSRIAVGDGCILYLYAPGQATAQMYDSQGRARGEVRYKDVADLFTHESPAPPAQRSGLLFDRQGLPVGSVDWSDRGSDQPLYVRRGTWQSTPLDSQTYRCQWHRIELGLRSLPPGSKIEVRTYAHEEQGAIAEVPLEHWQHAHTIVAPLQRPPCAGKTDSTIDFLVQSGGGQFLSIHLTVYGDGFSTPVVDTITAHYPRDSYLQYLPATYSADDESRVFLERFLAIFQTEWDGLDRTIAEIERFFDPDAVPAGPFLDFLATQWLGLRLEGNWTGEQRRALLVAAPEISAHHGQLAGLQRLIAVYLANLAGLEATAVEAMGFPVILEGFRERQHLFASVPESARLCEAAPLWSSSVVRRLQLGVFAREGEAELVSTDDPEHDVFSRYAHSFRVMVPASWIRTAAGERMLRRAIEAEKPAQTRYELCLVAPRFRLDAQSTVGVDTIIGAPMAAALGCASDEDAAPSLPPSGRLGYDMVLGCGPAGAGVRLTPGAALEGPSRLA